MSPPPRVRWRPQRNALGVTIVIFLLLFSYGLCDTGPHVGFDALHWASLDGVDLRLPRNTNLSMLHHFEHNSTYHHEEPHIVVFAANVFFSRNCNVGRLEPCVCVRDAFSAAIARLDAAATERKILVFGSRVPHRLQLNNARDVLIVAMTKVTFSHPIRLSSCVNVTFDGFSVLDIIVDDSDHIRLSGTSSEDTFRVFVADTTTRSPPAPVRIRVSGFSGFDTLSIVLRDDSRILCSADSVETISLDLLCKNGPCSGIFDNSTLAWALSSVAVSGRSNWLLHTSGGDLYVRRALCSRLAITGPSSVFLEGSAILDDLFVKSPFVISRSNASVVATNSVEIGDANSAVVLEANAVIRSGSVIVNGRRILLFGSIRATTTLHIGSFLDTSSVDVSGTLHCVSEGKSIATIRIIAHNLINIWPSAVVEAEGNAFACNGGLIEVGGVQASMSDNTFVRDLYVYRGSRISVDSFPLQGDAGTIILLSSDATLFNGRATARSGILTGEAGFIEISSLDSLHFDGITNLSSVAGSSGTLLLDPITVVIDVSGSNDNLLPVISSGTSPSSMTISASAIHTSLTTGDVSISATANITVNANIGTGAETHALTLSAGTTLSINAAISTSGAVTLSGSTGINANGSLISGTTMSLTASAGPVDVRYPITSGTQLTISGTTVSINGTVSAGTTMTVTATSGAITVVRNCTSSGIMTWSATDSLQVAGSATLATQGYTFSATCDSDCNGIGDLNIASGSSVLTSNGAGIISVNQLSLAGVIKSGSGSISLSGCSSKSIQFGGSAGAGTAIELTSSKLGQITTSGGYVLKSSSISVQAVSTSTSVELNARATGGTISFAGTSSFSSLNATAHSGISVLASISTTAGALVLDGDYSATFAGTTSITSNALLTSYTDLSIHPHGTGRVVVSCPASWSARNHVNLYAGTRVYGSGGDFSLVSDSAATGTGGALKFASTSNITFVSSLVTKLYLKGNAFQWSNGFSLSALSAKVVIDNSVSAAFSIGSGGSLTSATLSMITTTGTLQLGDTAVTDMSIYGFDRSGSSESLLSIHGASSVTFSTSATTVYANLYVSTAGNV
ncbi:hypothetical protein PBRA_007092, partial [Plasmodiophora brassicae]